MMRVRALLESSRSLALLWMLPALVLAVRGAGAAPAPSAARFSLSSPVLTPGGWMPSEQVYDRGGCGGRNRSPQLSWRHPPAGTRSFAVLVYDSDARGGWWHWLVIDIPATARALTSGAGDPGAAALPPGAVQTRNDFGSWGYGGPCPPPGPAHHYHVYLYALRVPRVAVAATAPAGAVAAAVRAAAIAEVEITVRYGQGTPPVAPGQRRG